MLGLTTLRDIEYQNDYHHKLRGRILKGIKGTEFKNLHDKNTVKFNFSNPFPRKNYNEGEEANVIVSSPHDAMINILAEHFRTNTEFNIGEMPFRVDKVARFSTDVGEPMTEGKLKSSVGLNLKISDEEMEEYQVGNSYMSNPSWEPDFGMELFKKKIVETTCWKLDEIYTNKHPNPDNFTDLFQAVELGRVFPTEIPINKNYTETLLAVQTTFDYQIENDQHRRWLNTLVDCGIGNRNPYGFGFMNIKDKKHPINNTDL